MQDISDGLAILAEAVRGEPGQRIFVAMKGGHNMTLAKGNKVIKLDNDGNPLTTERESYIKFEVEELTPHFLHQKAGTGTDETYVIALLRKLR